MSLDRQILVRASLTKDAFFNNIGTILTYAVVGTLFNAFATGVSLWAVNKNGLMPGLDEHYDDELGLLGKILFKNRTFSRKSGQYIRL